jgi:hypothetical protein
MRRRVSLTQLCIRLPLSLASLCAPAPLQNNVESVLLFCAMLVAIAGIMFNSDQLNPADDSGQVRQAALW